MRLNPDFRSADEVYVPGDIRNLTGWGEEGEDEQTKLDRESRMGDALRTDMPCATRSHTARKPNESMFAKFNEFQESKGRYPGSMDWSLLDEFMLGKPLVWLPQIIGSCVMSNTFRAYVLRQMYEIILLGDPEEYLGRSEFTPDSFSFYAPWSYGMARRRANMRGGDGLYCAPMAESLLKDGVLPCSTPSLVSLLERLNVAGDRDYPEPQGSGGARVYRQFGNWQYLDELKPYADFPVLESTEVTSASQLWDLLGDGKPTFVCSGEAVHKIGTHSDGFPIHAKNPRASWSHNMAYHGRFLSSDGERWFRHSNESWGPQHIYNRGFDEVDRVFGQYRMRSIGEVRSPIVAPPVFE